MCAFRLKFPSNLDKNADGFSEMALKEWPEIEAIRGPKARHELVIKGPLKRDMELSYEELQKLAFYDVKACLNSVQCNFRVFRSISSHSPIAISINFIRVLPIVRS